jgi:NAD(P)-dependent dehydrogenase (short-subunit alcohol dehydrogenase family)
VVLINSRQIRRLGQPRGGYAMSKAALFMAGQVLAHELGPNGVRVNTVVSGWMWGPAVEDYFAEASKTNGKTVDQQYQEVAETFALRRIPLPDEVAEAVVFLASTKASAITGQSLDVNAGESFH